MSENVVFFSPMMFLARKEAWQSSVWKPGYIPILKSDIPVIQKRFTSIIERKKKQLEAQEKLTSKATFLKDINTTELEDKPIEGTKNYVDDDKSKDIKIYDDNESVALKFLPLKQLIPKSVQEQIYTISLKGIPLVLSDNNIEKLIEELIKLEGNTDEPHLDVIDAWSKMVDPILEVQNVFIRFKYNPKVEQFCNKISRITKLLDGLKNDEKFSNIRLCYDVNTKQFIEDNRSKDFENASQEEMDNFAVSLIGFFNQLKSTSSNKLDTVDDISTIIDYKVDLDTLSDLPNHSLDQLCKDIVDFRTKVFTIEKEKKNQRLLEERNRRKTQIAKTLAGIKKSKNADGSSTLEKTASNDIAMDEEEEEEEESNAQYLNMSETDLAVWTHNLEIKKQESNQRYEKMLNQLHKDVEPRLKKIKNEMNKLYDYEKILKDNRGANIKHLLHLSEDAYYDHHSTYRKREQEKDNIDREEYDRVQKQRKTENNTMENGEAKDIDMFEPVVQKPEDFTIKFTFGKEKEKSKEKVEAKAIEETAEPEVKSSNEDIIVEKDDVDLTFNNTNDILPFDEDELIKRLQKLCNSHIVDEIIKEYLGVYEDDLVGYIIENIKENKDKNVLIEELQQTFDDDALDIVNRIWNRHEFKP